jgi:Protein of unknown function (DUF3987)/Bifunctional DNA primase/polymerase, N-terminal
MQLPEENENLVSNLETYKENLALAAEEYINEKRSVIVLNNTKNPIQDWTPLQSTRQTINCVRRELKKDSSGGIGIICGEISGNLEVLDIDLKNDNTGLLYPNLQREVEKKVPGLTNRLRVIKTISGGYHWYYTCDTISRNAALAKRHTTESEQQSQKYETTKVLIETRGQGGYVVTYPTKGYTVEQDCPVPHITVEEREGLFECSKRFNEVNIPIFKNQGDEIKESQFEVTPWDDFNKRGDIPTLLIKHGFTIVKEIDKRIIIRRPGKDEGTSGDFRTDLRLLKLFSTSTVFEAGRGYRPTAIFAFLECNGDFRLASKKLFQMGYGRKVEASNSLAELESKADERLNFPLEIFSPQIQDYINKQVVHREFIAGAVISALAACIGNTAYLQAMHGYRIKTVLYLVIVGPPGSSKSPAIKIAFAPLENYDRIQYRGYQEKMMDYKQKMSAFRRDKKNSLEPIKPQLVQILMKDSTIEKAIDIMSQNKHGNTILSDELSGFLNRLNQYKDKEGDEVQKWLENWSSMPILVQRIGRDDNRVDDPFCGIFGGIQPGILEQLSKNQNEHNGFYHRFLFIFPEQKKKEGWRVVEIPQESTDGYNDVFEVLLSWKDQTNPTEYRLSEEAEMIYREWFDKKNQKYDSSFNENIKGIIAKYQDYCLRLALLIQVVDDGLKRLGVVHGETMDKAIKLTEYFFSDMNKTFKFLAPESPADKLQPPYSSLYYSLNSEFSTANAVELGKKLKIPEASVRGFLTKNLVGAGGSSKKLFLKKKHGCYEKV